MSQLPPDLERQRKQSQQRLASGRLGLVDRHSRRFDEHNIMDIRTCQIVKDNGAIRSSKRAPFGGAIGGNEAERIRKECFGSEPEDDEGSESAGDAEEVDEDESGEEAKEELPFNKYLLELEEEKEVVELLCRTEEEEEEEPLKKARRRPSKKAGTPEKDENVKQAAETISQKGREPKPTASQKRSTAKAVAEPDAAECDGEPHEEVKSKRKSHKNATIKPTTAQKKGKAKAIAEPIVADSNAKREPAVETSKGSSKPTCSKKLNKAHVEASEDDDLPEPPKRASKSAPVPHRSGLADEEPDTRGTARKKPLSVVEEEEEEEEEGSQVDKNQKRDGGMDAPVQPRKRTFNEITSTPEDTLDAGDHSLRKRCKTAALAKCEVAGDSSNPASLTKPRPRKASAAAEDVEKAPKSNSRATKRKKTAVQELSEHPSKKPRVETVPLSRKTSQKENIQGAPKASEDSKIFIKVAHHKGPPKSVLQRIQKSKHDDDNEPDPIDFLS